MIKLRIALQAYLKALHPRVYYQDAPESATYPYIVYDLPNTIDTGEYEELIVVDIDGWDAPANGDTTALEALMTKINSLNKTVLTADDMRAVFYLDTKLALTDDDPRIKRRRYTYQAKLFKGE